MSADQAAGRITLRRHTGPLSRAGAVLRGAWRRRWVRWLAILLSLPFIAYAILWLIFARNLPSAESLLNYEPVLPTYVRDIDGAPVQSFARERRVQLTYDEFPPHLIHAFLAAEDRTFFSHPGIDIPGIVSALFTNLTSSGRPVGASTITQQVAKNLLLTNEVTYTRKIRELFLARRIESVLEQGADPRALPQPDLPRPERLWRPGRVARLFQQGRAGPQYRRGGLSRRPAQGAEQLRSGPRHIRRPEPAQLGARRDGAQWLHHRRAARGGGARAARHGARRRRDQPQRRRLFHGGGAPQPDRRATARPRRTARTASMPAACGCAPPTIRRCSAPPRRRFATASPATSAAAAGAIPASASTSRATGAASSPPPSSDPAIRAGARRRYSRRTAARRGSASPTAAPEPCPPRWPRCPGAAPADRRSTRSARARSSRSSARARAATSGRCARSRKSPAAWSSRRSPPAGSSPCRAASTSAAPISTAPPRRCASPARPSSRSSTPPRSTTA